MSLNRYARGALVRVSGSFVDSAGAAVDPTVVRVKYRAPGQTAATQTTLTYLTDAALVRDSAGHYHADVDTTGAYGQWRYRWESTGAGQAAGEWQFWTEPSALD